jgi:SAM-dependent methyltransferase
MTEHDARDWDAVAPRFEERVCNVLAEDRGRVVARALAAEAKRLRRPRRPVLVGDFGCGTGRALPLLAAHFDDAIAVDASAECIALARRVGPRPGSIAFVHADLGRPGLALPGAGDGVDLGLCVNVAIMPNRRLRDRILENVARHVRPGGRLLLVVPAHESELLVRRREAERNGSRPGARRSERPLEGLFELGGTLTKTWTREELLDLAPRLRCDLVAIERVEYGWHTEFERPPRSLREPFPWDWLAVLERRRAPRAPLRRAW